MRPSYYCNGGAVVVMFRYRLRHSRGRGAPNGGWRRINSDKHDVPGGMWHSAFVLAPQLPLPLQLGSANRGALINPPSNTPGLLFGIRLGQTHTLTSEMYFVRRGRNRARKGAESPVTSF